MKKRSFSLLLIMLLAISAFSGCSPYAVEARLDRAEDAIENQLDAAENAVENALSPRPATPAQPEAISETRFPSAEKPAPASALTKADAEAVALEHANFAREQVDFLRTEYEFDDGIYKYDIEFRQGRWEYDYTIHAETGAILSFDRDD